MANPLDVIREADAELYEQMTNVRELAFQEGALSQKHKLLIALAIEVVEHSEGGIRSLAQQALHPTTPPETDRQHSRTKIPAKSRALGEWHSSTESERWAST